MDPLYKCTNGLLGVMVIGNPIKFNFTKTLKKNINWRTGVQ